MEFGESDFCVLISPRKSGKTTLLLEVYKKDLSTLNPLDQIHPRCVFFTKSEEGCERFKAQLPCAINLCTVAAIPENPLHRIQIHDSLSHEGPTWIYLDDFNMISSQEWEFLSSELIPTATRVRAVSSPGPVCTARNWPREYNIYRTTTTTSS